MKQSRPFGCEFEFSTKWDDAVPLISAVIPKKRLRIEKAVVRTRNNRAWWHLKTDGTTEIELVTPISKLEDVTDIRKTIMRLSSSLKVSGEDGFHVHVSAKDVDIRLLGIYWTRCERSIFSLVNKKRLDNNMCDRVAESYKEGIHSLMTALEDHHSSLSCFYYKDRKTVEIRVAEGTRDWNFVEAWINFCVAFVEYVAKADPISVLTDKPFKISVEQMFDDIRLPVRHRMILLSRNKRINAPLAWAPGPPCKRVGQVRFLSGAPTRQPRQYAHHGPSQSFPFNSTNGEWDPDSSSSSIEEYYPYHLQGL